MKPVVISASTRVWLDCKEYHYPQDENDYPFWATLEDERGMRRIELVKMTEHGLCYTTEWGGESYGENVTELVTHWMPQDIPRYKPKHEHEFELTPEQAGCGVLPDGYGGGYECNCGKCV